MLPSKLKRKLADDKGKTSNKGKQENEVAAEVQSDYESDEVNFFVDRHVLLSWLLFTSRVIFVLGEFPGRDSKRRKLRR